MYSVFTKKGCSVCKSVTNILKRNNIQFVEINVGEHEGLVLAEKLGISHSGAIIDENMNVLTLDQVLKKEKN